MSLVLNCVGVGEGVVGGVGRGGVGGVVGGEGMISIVIKAKTYKSIIDWLVLGDCNFLVIAKGSAVS